MGQWQQQRQGQGRARGRGKPESGDAGEVLGRVALTVWWNQEKGRLLVLTQRGSLSMLKGWQSSNRREEFDARRHGSGDLEV